MDTFWYQITLTVSERVNAELLTSSLIFKDPISLCSLSSPDFTGCRTTLKGHVQLEALHNSVQDCKETLCRSALNFLGKLQ